MKPGNSFESNSALNKGVHVARQNKSLLNLIFAGSWMKGSYRSDADSAS